jgi:hypothetical protein
MGFSPQHVSAVELGQTAVSEQFIQACDDALRADGQLLELLPSWSMSAHKRAGPIGRRGARTASTRR